MSNNTNSDNVLSHILSCLKNGRKWGTSIQLQDRVQLLPGVISKNINSILKFINELSTEEQIVSALKSVYWQMLSVVFGYASWDKNPKYFLTVDQTDSLIDAIRNKIDSLGYRIRTKDIDEFDDHVSVNDLLNDLCTSRRENKYNSFKIDRFPRIYYYKTNDWERDERESEFNVYDKSNDIHKGDIIIVGRKSKNFIGYGVVADDKCNPYNQNNENDPESSRRRKVNWRFVSPDKFADLNKYIDDNRGGYFDFNGAHLITIDYRSIYRLITEVLDIPECKDALNQWNIDHSQINSSTSDNEDDIMNDNINNFDKNLILCGPPGTGKTYHLVNYAVAIIKNQSLENVLARKREDLRKAFEQYVKEKRIEFVTFHQSYGYEEFIEGLRPVLANSDKSEQSKDVKYEIVPGVFKSFCDHIHGKDNPSKQPVNETKIQESPTVPQDDSADTLADHGEHETEAEPQNAAAPAPKNYVFIIDEINRGNISKIFGELITLIEESRREGESEETRAPLLQSKEEKFVVPSNLYIIGTMNTADRSITQIDTALRRRFSFREMMPDTSTLEGCIVDRINIKKMLETINKRIEYLMDREHQIGHAYLLPLKQNNTIKNLGKIFKDKIIPLLQEYFFDDYEKIRLVLGDTGKEDKQHQFITKETPKVKDLFPNAGDIDLDEKSIYTINEGAFDHPQSYIEIYPNTEEGSTEGNTESADSQSEPDPNEQ